MKNYEKKQNTFIVCAKCGLEDKKKLMSGFNAELIAYQRFLNFGYINLNGYLCFECAEKYNKFILESLKK